MMEIEQFGTRRLQTVTCSRCSQKYAIWQPPLCGYAIEGGANYSKANSQAEKSILREEQQVREIAASRGYELQELMDNSSIVCKCGRKIEVPDTQKR